MLSHPHITKAWVKWEFKDDSPKQVLVIETNLELDNQADEFDSSKLDDLIDYAHSEFDKRKTSLDRVDIIPG